MLIGFSFFADWVHWSMLSNPHGNYMFGPYLLRVGLIPWMVWIKPELVIFQSSNVERDWSFLCLLLCISFFHATFVACAAVACFHTFWFCFLFRCLHRAD